MLTKSEMGGFSGVPSTSGRHYPERARVGVSYHRRTLPWRIAQCYRGCNVVARGWDNDSTSLFAGLFWALRLGDGWVWCSETCPARRACSSYACPSSLRDGQHRLGPPNALVKRPRLRRSGGAILAWAGTEAWARTLHGGPSGVVTGFARRGAGKARAHASAPTQARIAPPDLRSLGRLTGALGCLLYTSPSPRD